ncbi:MAG: M14 family zinc carboxypeptidase [Candidatus Marinimicrobia bacterium]|nr:M14 family zinc carboxypeptidase [Candidatus Neomarinimicrobiota bacterium]
MRVFIGFCLLLILAPFQAGAQSNLRDSVIDPRYHTYEEVVAYMDSIQDIPAYAAILEVREIGRSNNEDLPIYAVKLSDNPTQDEDEPALLFMGQCHAEEILGLEITIGLIDSLLHGFDANNPHVMSILENLEVWAIPTYNPEGLRVVHDGLDVSYRKNKTDNNNNGIFDYVPGIGYDIDGVDFNRNFNFNWIFGDEYEVGDYDYYRGPSPFSESEVRAVAALARQEQFLLSVAYHSARSGTPEIIYYSWEWEETKQPPDIEIMSSMANILAQRIINESGDGNYSVTPGKTPRGNAHDWFYTQTGSIQFLMEVGTNNLQPNAAIIDDTVERNLEGIFYLMDRAFGRAPESKAMITGIVTDASDGFALEGAQIRLAKLAADWSLTELEGLMMQPRVTDGFGRYRRLVNQGTYRVIASAPGFGADTIPAVFTSDSYATILDFSLEPMTIRQIDLDLTQSTGIDAYEVIVWDETQRDTLTMAPGVNRFDWQGNELFLGVSAEGYFPENHHFDLSNATTFTLTVTLPAEPVTAYSTGFDDLTDWNITSGSWATTAGKLVSQPDLFYAAGLDMEITLPNINLDVFPDAQRLGVVLKHAYEVEWHLDTLALELWTADESELLISQTWVDQNFKDHTETFFIHGSIPVSGLLKLQMKTDSTVGFRGWQIDSLALFLSESEFVGIDPVEKERNTPGFSQDAELSATLSPNPLQKQTELNFTVPNSGMGQIQVFDIRGREIYQEHIYFNAGANSWIWLGQDLSGHSVSKGIYFLRLTGTQQTITRKLMVIDKF